MVFIEQKIDTLNSGIMVTFEFGLLSALNIHKVSSLSQYIYFLISFFSRQKIIAFWKNFPKIP